MGNTNTKQSESPQPSRGNAQTLGVEDKVTKLLMLMVLKTQPRFMNALGTLDHVENRRRLLRRK